MNVPFYSMVNLIAGRAVVPELMQDEMTGEALAREAGRLLDDPEAARRNEGRSRAKYASSSPAGDAAAPRAPPWSSKRFWKDKLLMFRNRTFARRCCSLALALLAPALGAGTPLPHRRGAVHHRGRDLAQHPVPHRQGGRAVHPARRQRHLGRLRAEQRAQCLARGGRRRASRFPASRNQQDFTVRLSFDQPLPKGQPVTITFYYDGRLTGQEDSPVYGIKFAAIHPDYAYLMYPARWFPVSGYTTDRFAADLHITVPTGYTVLASGLEQHQEPSADKTRLRLSSSTRPSFPGSIAVVKGEPARVVQRRRHHQPVLPRRRSRNGAALRADQIGKMMSYFTGLFGLPPYANLTVVETEDGAPNGYAAPGMIFLAPRGIGKQVNAKLLANQVSRQWWEELVSPTTAQSPLAHQRPRRLLRTPVDRALKQRPGRHGIAAAAT